MVPKRSLEYIALTCFHDKLLNCICCHIAFLFFYPIVLALVVSQIVLWFDKMQHKKKYASFSLCACLYVLA